MRLYISPAARDNFFAISVLFLLSSLLVSEVLLRYLGAGWEATEIFFPIFSFWYFLIVLYIIGIFRLKDRDRLLALILSQFFFLFRYETLLQIGFLPLQALAVVAGTMIVSAVLILRYRSVAIILSQTLIVLFIFQLFFAGKDIVRMGVTLRYDESQIPPKPALYDETKVSLRGKAAPDIYLFLFDAYAGIRPLKRLFGHDNIPFLDFLRGQGFYVAEKSRSNYVYTELSMSSTLNLNYFQNDIVLPRNDLGDRTVAGRYRSSPRLYDFLLSQGYTIYMDGDQKSFWDSGGGSEVSFKPSPVRLSFAKEFLQRTPLYLLLSFVLGKDRSFMNVYHDRYMFMLEKFDFFKEVSALDETRPIFFYAHINLPHPPFIFNADGSFATENGLVPPSLMDGMKSSYPHIYPGGWREHYRRSYPAQLQYTNVLIEDMVTDLIPQLKERGRPFVILIQSDHGSRMDMHFRQIEKTDLDESFENLNAVYYSDGDYTGLTPDVTPINVMRHTVQKYFGVHLPPLENRQWYSPWDKPYAFVDVTDRLKPFD